MHGLFDLRQTSDVCCLNWSRVSPNVTTQGCGNVWREFSTPVSTKEVAMADWVCETARSAQQHFASWGFIGHDGAARARHNLTGVQSFELPSWESKASFPRHG